MRASLLKRNANTIRRVVLCTEVFVETFLNLPLHLFLPASSSCRLLPRRTSSNISRKTDVNLASWMAERSKRAKSNRLRILIRNNQRSNEFDAGQHIWPGSLAHQYGAIPLAPRCTTMMEHWYANTCRTEMNPTHETHIAQLLAPSPTPSPPGNVGCMWKFQKLRFSNYFNLWQTLRDPFSAVRRQFLRVRSKY